MKIQSPITKRRVKKLAQRKLEFEEFEESALSKNDKTEKVTVNDDIFTKNMRENGGLMQRKNSEQVVIRYDKLPPCESISLLKDSFRQPTIKEMPKAGISAQAENVCDGAP
eukprot:CFRG0431T1